MKSTKHRQIRKERAEKVEIEDLELLDNEAEETKENTEGKLESAENWINKNLNQNPKLEKLKKRVNGLKKYNKIWKWLSPLYIVILALYPLRHIHWGLDLMDTGYNYANFKYMGLDSMNPMWMFSTYLSNAVGFLFTKLPMGDTLAGMNFYTGLFVSLLALTGYFFCTKKLEMPKFLVFVGEFTAISLCWCPTALLYNYMTYLLFLVAVILLYVGLTDDRKWCLFTAGICLGVNVLVRFSNLPEAGLIVAVWAYGIIEAVDSRRKNAGKEAFGRTFFRTMWCLGGYLAALAVSALYIQIRYGLDAYVAGIKSLFAMTERATDYKATSMVLGLLLDYKQNLPWVWKFIVVAFLGILLFAIVRFLMECKSVFRKHQDLATYLRLFANLLWIVVCGAMLVWFYRNGFYSFSEYKNGAIAIWQSGVVFLMLTILIALVRIFHRDTEREERLISGLVLLVVLITPLGSNNKNFSSLNNLFIAAPYVFWEIWRFCNKVYDKELVQAVIFPIKAVLAAFLVLIVVHSGVFGARFLFEDTKGAQNLTATVENNTVLKGIKMSPERAEWMTTISEYVEENDLQGREVILYGQIPSLSYYLQMPSAFNPWSDLASYSLESFEADLKVQQKEILTKIKPVIIISKAYSLYIDGGVKPLRQEITDPNLIKRVESDEKVAPLKAFMERNKYKNTFSNDQFAIWK